MSIVSTRRRALVFAVTLTGAAVLAEAAKPRRRDAERAKLPLGKVFPSAFGRWRIDARGQAFVQPADEQGKLYGVYDQVLERAYVSNDNERVMLCVAYGSEQSPALQVHRPEICYASGGFRVSGKRETLLSVASRRLSVTTLHAVKVGRAEPITYWTVFGDDVVGGSENFRWRQLAAGLRGEVRDGMLVRISSIGHDAEAGYRLHAAFAAELLQAMPAQYHARVFGSLPTA